MHFALFSFTRVNVFLPLVYLLETENAGVELPIVTTYLQGGGAHPQRECLLVSMGRTT